MKDQKGFDLITIGQLVYIASYLTSEATNKVQLFSTALNTETNSILILKANLILLNSSQNLSRVKVLANDLYFINTVKDTVFRLRFRLSTGTSPDVIVKATYLDLFGKTEKLVDFDIIRDTASDMTLTLLTRNSIYEFLIFEDSPDQDADFSKLFDRPDTVPTTLYKVPSAEETRILSTKLFKIIAARSNGKMAVDVLNRGPKGTYVSAVNRLVNQGLYETVLDMWYDESGQNVVLATTAALNTYHLADQANSDAIVHYNVSTDLTIASTHTLTNDVNIGVSLKTASGEVINIQIEKVRVMTDRFKTLDEEISVWYKVAVFLLIAILVADLVAFILYKSRKAKEARQANVEYQPYPQAEEVPYTSA